MPTLEQLRYEKLAAAVERAGHPWPLRFLSSAGQYVDARVQRLDRSTIEFKLREVVLDGELLAGCDTRERVVTVPLAEVKAVWRRRYHRGRTAAVCGAALAATTAALAVGSPAPVTTLAVFGPMIGLPIGVLISVMLNQFKLLSEWTLLYYRGGTNG
jgi:ABC-type cobalamin transport system permease subunit